LIASAARAGERVGSRAKALERRGCRAELQERRLHVPLRREHPVQLEPGGRRFVWSVDAHPQPLALAQLARRRVEILGDGREVPRCEGGRSVPLS
jgi:hypothetical protein